MDDNKDKKIIKSPYYSLEKLSADSSLVKRGLRDLSIWPKIEELFEKLKELFKAGKIQECINISEEILKTDSNHFFTLCYYGRSLYLAERYKEALKVLDRCLEEEKHYYFLWSFRGDVYYKMGEYLEAVKNYDESLKLELYEFWYRATGNERKAGDPSKTPESTDALDNHMYYFSDDNDDNKELDEIGFFRKALFYLSTNFESYQKDDIGIKRAIEALQKVIKSNPNNWFAKNKIVETSELLANKQKLEKQRQDALVNNDTPWIDKNAESDKFHYRALLAHKYDGDPEMALKYFNLALEALAQGIYEKIKNEPLRGTDLKSMDFNYTGEEKEGWVDMATRVAIKNATSDGVRAVRFPTGETAQKIVQESPVIGVAIYDDKDTNRYILPAYFSSFYLALKSNIQYSNIYYNSEKFFSETGQADRAKKCYEESVRFLPKGVEYQMLENHTDFVGLAEKDQYDKPEKIVLGSGSEFTDVYGKKFTVVPQTEEEIEQNRKKIEELRAKGLLQKHEKTFKIQKDGTVVEEE